MPSGPENSKSPFARPTLPAVGGGAGPGRMLPVLILVAGWMLSAWMYVLLSRATEQHAAEFFGERVAEAQAAIAVRMNHYVDALRGGVSFYAAARPVDRDGWRIYAESLQLPRRYPGINGLGVILVVPPDGLPAWQRRVRGADAPDVEIRPFPGTKPGPPDDPKYLITFVEGNTSDRPPIGRDIATDPSRRRAAELARDTGEPQINLRIPGSRDTQRRSGLLLYVPLYAAKAPLATVAERRAAHLGWVYAQVFPDVYLAGVLGPMSRILRLHFFETGGLTRERLLYASDDVADAALPKFERITEMELAGQRFQLGWDRGPRFPAVDNAPAVLVGGSLATATLLLAGLIMSLQSVGRRANAVAAARTAELATSEERFRHAFDFAGIGMALVGLDGRWLRVNKSLCEILGYSEVKLLQKNTQDVTHPEDLAADLNLRRELLDGERRFYQLEKRFIHREGHTVWIRLTCSLVRDAAGAPLHCIGQIEDITERKRLERNLASARDEALAASRHKSEFLAAMSDEIRTPMTALQEAARQLRGMGLAPGQMDQVRTIEAAGGMLVTVISDIVDFSRIEAGQFELECAPFDLRQCVNDALAVYADQARQKRVQLGATVAARVPTHVVGDARRLHQILLNLLKNAVKFTAAGEIRVTLTAEALDAQSGRQRLKFAVRDTGVGVPPETLERLFKSYATADDAARRWGGTGLGLAISKRLAELMGGTMWAQSEPGRGSTFHFTVLVQPCELPSAPSAAALAGVHVLPPGAGSS